MKQLLVALVFLAAALTLVNAQELNDKVLPAPSSEVSPPHEQSDIAPSTLKCSASDAQAECSPEQFTRAVHVARYDFTPAPHLAPSSTPEHFRWGAAFEQSLLFLSVQHGYALTQPKTRRELGGNFFKDYARSVRSLHGWGDGGRFFTNYVAHPMQGSLLGFVQIQNDPAGSRLKFGRSGAYWRSRMKALGWSAAWSTQFEIGPISQASIGNVGLHGKQTYVDLVMTPTAGLGLLVVEDALDRYVIERIERRTNNRYVRILSRMALNPTRSSANLLRFKKPWHRDAGLR
ncbi:MAG TPA: hypothetical protein VGO96_00720 [Pyrinomonadaceae bacterium]|nr:hypothetical protein [Pyrinomonadaceae bacterium]